LENLNEKYNLYLRVMSIVIHNDKLYSGGVVEPYVVIGTNRVSVL